MSSTSSDPYEVVVYLYDLTHGMAKQLSPGFLGKQIDGIWHTGIVVYGWEYYYGGGIQAARPGQTMAGKPHQIFKLGKTNKSQKDFHTFLQAEGHRFTPETYSLLSNNCNNFTSHCAKYLLDGGDIPAFITGLPEDALSTPMGQMIKPVILGMEQQMKDSMNQGRPGFIPWSEGDGTSIMLPPVSHTSPHPAVVLYPGTLTGNPTSTPCVTTTTPGITTATSTTTTTTATSTTPSEAKAASIAMSFASAPMPSPHVPDDAKSLSDLRFKRFSPKALYPPPQSFIPQLPTPSFASLVKAYFFKPTVADDPKIHLSPQEHKELTSLLDTLASPTPASTTLSSEALTAFDRLLLSVELRSIVGFLGLVPAILNTEAGKARYTDPANAIPIITKLRGLLPSADAAAISSNTRLHAIYAAIAFCQLHMNNPSIASIFTHDDWVAPLAHLLDDDLPSLRVAASSFLLIISKPLLTAEANSPAPSASSTSTSSTSSSTTTPESSTSTSTSTSSSPTDPSGSPTTSSPPHSSSSPPPIDALTEAFVATSSRLQNEAVPSVAVSLLLYLCTGAYTVRSVRELLLDIDVSPSTSYSLMMMRAAEITAAISSTGGNSANASGKQKVTAIEKAEAETAITAAELCCDLSLILAFAQKSRA